MIETFQTYQSIAMLKDSLDHDDFVSIISKTGGADGSVKGGSSKQIPSGKGNCIVMIGTAKTTQNTASEFTEKRFNSIFFRRADWQSGVRMTSASRSRFRKTDDSWVEYFSPAPHCETKTGQIQYFSELTPTTTSSTTTGSTIEAHPVYVAVIKPLNGTIVDVVTIDSIHDQLIGLLHPNGTRAVRHFLGPEHDQVM